MWNKLLGYKVRSVTHIRCHLLFSPLAALESNLVAPLSLLLNPFSPSLSISYSIWFDE